MRLLLDTHIFLWFISRDSQLAIAVRDAIRNPRNEVFLSVVSLWEIIIKHQIGKLPLPQAPDIYVPAQRARHQIASLSIDEASIIQVANLPLLHRDPFDRLLIGQALEHSLTLVTVDPVIQAYPAISVL